MKQLIVRLGLMSMALLWTMGLAYAVESPATPKDALAPVESKLFARDFAAESLENRLSRLETLIFGQPQTGNLDERQARLGSIVSQALRKTDTPDTAKTNTPAASNALPAAPPQNRDATDYPAVTQLEEFLLGQTYPQEDVSRRLTRLEQKVFLQSFDELPMVDRVDQLTLKIFPKSPLGLEEGTVATKALPKTGQELASSSLAIYAQVTTLEEQVFGKSFGGDLLANRLARLEHRIFGAPREGTIDGRMESLLKHLANKPQPQPQQRPSAQIAQVGAPQAYSPKPSQNWGRSLPSPQAMGGAEAGSPKFSREFLEMLPPGVRQQMEGRGIGTVVGTATQNNRIAQTPTYTTPQSSAGAVVPYVPPRSLYTYPGASAWGVPYVPVVPQPQPNPMNYPGGALGPLMNQSPNLVPPSQVQGSTANVNTLANINASLLLLENQLFGQPYTGVGMLQRLSNLEQRVFGRTFPHYPPQQRINQLMLQVPFGRS